MNRKTIILILSVGIFMFLIGWVASNYFNAMHPPVTVTSVASSTPAALGTLTLEELNWYANDKGIVSDENKYFTDTTRCFKAAPSHVFESDCLAKLQKRLEDTESSLVEDIMRKRRIYDTQPDDAGAIAFLDKALHDWLLQTTAENGTQADKCVVESTKSYQGTGQSDDFRQCMIREDATNILWLLKMSPDLTFQF